MGIYHLSVQIGDKQLIYDRILKPGSGESVYGLLVAQCMIKDRDFLNLADRMSEMQLAAHNKVLNLRYRVARKAVTMLANMFMLRKVRESDTLDTHHQFHQEDCDDEGYEQSFTQESKWNLQILCHKCHGTTRI